MKENGILKAFVIFIVLSVVFFFFIGGKNDFWNVYVKRNYTGLVEGTVVELEEHEEKEWRGRGTVTRYEYRIYYDYVVDGVTYHDYNDCFFYSKIRNYQKGDSLNIMYLDEDDSMSFPQFVYEEDVRKLKESIFSSVFASLCLGLFSLIKKNRNR
ncbi:MAG: hypothetical protein Q4D51_11400 [Eubacteriales bacterium]|nr:hypothetical protein [Eubacteriales bacterium]